MTFTMESDWPTIVELATELWGQSNKAQSRRDDIRFGSRASKSVKPSASTWFDHEANFGGGYIDLHVRARGEPPRFKMNGGLKPWDDIAAIYQYRNADNSLAFEVIRTITGAPRFRQRKPDGSKPHGWDWHTKDIPIEQRPLYRLPELLSAMPGSAFVCEGEKDCDNIHKLGLTATCNAGGAAEHKDPAKPYRGKWHPAWSEHLRGRAVVILPDNDAPGEAHANDVARKLSGIAASIKVLKLPDLPPKGDVSDWIASGGTKDALLALADATPISAFPSAQPKEPRSQRATLNVLALVTHLNTTAAWNGVLRFNLFTENYEVCGSLPPPKDGAKGPPRAFRDPQDALTMEMYFQASGFPKAGKNVTFDAVAAVAHTHAYHPVHDYLGALKWDGTERVGKLFWHYFNAEVPEAEAELYPHLDYLQHISTGFLVGAVARVMQPGCKHDHVPVVVGRERLLKSTAIRALCQDPAWFCDDISPNLIERDTKESLAGKWLIELAEIPHIQKESERVKAFFSRCVDRYRSAYGKTNQDHARQCVFIGTSNSLEFVDVTGNRRFWPFRVAGPIDVAAIVADRDQLWAEAFALYRQGVPWWLPPRIEDIAAEQQAGFVEDDVWEDLIARWLGSQHGPFTMENLFAKDTGITPYREVATVDKRDQMRAARCLIKLGWVKQQRRVGGRKARWWHRP
jgi:hypothetical protein